MIAELIKEANKIYQDNNRYAGPLALSDKNGDIPAKIFFVSEAPGRLGAGATGIPFFSLKNEQSAKRFGILMAKLGIDCDVNRGWKGHNVFVTDVILRNPVEPGANGLRNRRITNYEIKLSLGLLQKQIELVNPEIIVAVGKKAAEALSELSDCKIEIDGKFLILEKKV